MPALVTRRAPGSPKLDSSSVRRLAEAMLRALELDRAELSVLLTNDATIHGLNRQHRGQNRPTDVLSFPLEFGGESARSSSNGSRCESLLGDVVISLDTAQRQANSRRRPLVSEVRFLLAHGLLHLLGFDHDTRRHKREMDAMARRLVRAAPLPTRAAEPIGHPRKKPRSGRRMRIEGR